MKKPLDFVTPMLKMYVALVDNCGSFKGVTSGADGVDDA
jgi:hypothetical protein